MTRNQRRKKAFYKKSSISIYATIAIVLNKEFKWGKKRISKLLEQSQHHFELLENGEITINEILDICKSKKIDINKKTTI